jgi:hypothetical protein
MSNRARIRIELVLDKDVLTKNIRWMNDRLAERIIASDRAGREQAEEILNLLYILSDTVDNRIRRASA